MRFGAVHTRAACALLVALALSMQASAGSILHVDGNAQPDGDGATWQTACRFLQDALAIAANPANGITEIRVAQGVYQPDRSESNPSGGGDRNATFDLIDNIALRGGYLGLVAGKGQDPDQRDINLHPTILSGDLAGNDQPPTPKNPGDFPNSSENAYQVVTALNLAQGATLDGFTIVGGHADGPGLGADPASRDQGSAINIYYASAVINDCTFKWNWSADRAAVNDHGPATTISGCAFIGNFAASGAGGLFIAANSMPAVSNCQFQDNIAFGNGGAVDCAGLTQTSIVNCAFTNNSGTLGGGVHIGNSGASVIDCSFSGNTASKGGGAFNDNNTASLINCDFHNNTATSGGAGLWNDDGAPVIDHCTFTANSSDGGGSGIWNVHSDAVMLTCTFTSNTSLGPGAALYNLQGSPIVDHCAFVLNETMAAGGGGIWNGSSNPTVAHCVFDSNLAASGGAIYSSEHSTPSVTDCIFTGNHALEGGAVYSFSSDTLVAHCSFSGNGVEGGDFPVGGALVNYYCNSTTRDCTFVQNHADMGGAAVYNEGQFPILINCRFEHNATTNRDTGWGGGVFNGYFCTPTLSNCVFVGNSANRGGAVFDFTFSASALVNCTIVGNVAGVTAPGFGGGVYTFDRADTTIANGIIWNNAPDQIDGGSTTVTFSCIQGGYPGIGNKSGDPLFVANPDPGPDGNWGTDDDEFGDLHLRSGSPCVDAGDNAAVPAMVTIDIDGNPRFADDPKTPDSGISRDATPLVDMGAYELQPAPPCAADINHDGAVNASDLLAVINGWGSCPAGHCPEDVNVDGTVNAGDLLSVINAWGACP